MRTKITDSEQDIPVDIPKLDRPFLLPKSVELRLVKHIKIQKLGFGLNMDDRGSWFRFPAGAGNFSLHHRVQNGSRAHPASYQMGTRGSFRGGKAAAVWNLPLTSI
jgi:hypothetical protein